MRKGIPKVCLIFLRDEYDAKKSREQESLQIIALKEFMDTTAFKNLPEDAIIPFSEFCDGRVSLPDNYLSGKGPDVQLFKEWVLLEAAIEEISRANYSEFIGRLANAKTIPAVNTITIKFLSEKMKTILKSSKIKSEPLKRLLYNHLKETISKHVDTRHNEIASADRTIPTRTEKYLIHLGANEFIQLHIEEKEDDFVFSFIGQQDEKFEFNRNKDGKIKASDVVILLGKGPERIPSREEALAKTEENPEDYTWLYPVGRLSLSNKTTADFENIANSFNRELSTARSKTQIQASPRLFTPRSSHQSSSRNSGALKQPEEEKKRFSN